MKQVMAEVFLELEPKLDEKWQAGAYVPFVQSAKVVRQTKTKPDNVGRNNVVVKVRLYVPEHMFISGVPEAVITVPDDPDEVVTVTAQFQEE